MCSYGTTILAPDYKGRDYFHTCLFLKAVYRNPDWYQYSPISHDAFLMVILNLDENVIASIMLKNLPSDLLWAF